MGVYVHKTTPTAVATIVMETPEGERRTVEVQMYEFAFKCFRMEEDERTWKRVCGPAERAFERRGTKPAALGIGTYQGSATIGEPVFETRGRVAGIEITDSKPVGKIVSLVSSRSRLTLTQPRAWFWENKPAPVAAPQPIAGLDGAKPAAAITTIEFTL